MNTSRPDGERFFAYQSERLKREFPIVIRLVERLKTEWEKKIAVLASQLSETASTESDQSAIKVEHKVRESIPLDELEGPASAAASVSETQPPVFVHSENYDSISFNGQSYTLQERQAAVVKLLHEALRKGHPAVSGRKILSLPGCTEASAVRDIFKSRLQLWGTLIVNCEDTREGRGFYRLHPSITA